MDSIHIDRRLTMNKVSVPTLACLALLAAVGTQLAGCADSRTNTAPYPSSSSAAPAAQPSATTTENAPAQDATWNTWQPAWMAPRVVGSGEK
jgi:hypothetical protein